MKDSITKLGAEDRTALARMYKFIFDFLESLSPNFQIIITDHADLPDPRFQSSVVERWRDMKGGLIPQDWIEI